ncbi:MAG: 50S ribosomal protein L11 methyltransferase [Candidatus Thorarchaeota archaeon]|jgi:type II protein arginine methyltransferase
MMTDREYATPFTMLHAVTLLGQKTRLAKFSEAIQRVVKTSDYVVDIGTGSGILAIMCAKAGAEKVTAIDVNRESIEYARKAAAVNGVTDQIDFFEGHFSDFIPEERADFVICEMLSSMMLIEQQVSACSHAVETILKPEGVIIPQHATVFTVPVESQIMDSRYGFEMIHFPKVVQSSNHEITKDLADAQVLYEIDFTKPSGESGVDKTSSFDVVNDGTIHGLVSVFESRLIDDINLRMEDGWKPLFIPIDKPVEVKTGDQFSVRIAFTPGDYNSLVIETL